VRQTSISIKTFFLYVKRQSQWFLPISCLLAIYFLPKSPIFKAMTITQELVLERLGFQPVEQLVPIPDLESLTPFAEPIPCTPGGVDVLGGTPVAEAQLNARILSSRLPSGDEPIVQERAAQRRLGETGWTAAHTAPKKTHTVAKLSPKE
jgi:hypothetical protein